MLAYKWLEPIQKSQKPLNDKITRLELAKTPINKRRSELLDSLRPVLRGVRDYIRTEMRENANKNYLTSPPWYFNP